MIARVEGKQDIRVCVWWCALLLAEMNIFAILGLRGEEMRESLIRILWLRNQNMKGWQSAYSENCPEMWQVRHIHLSNKGYWLKMETRNRSLQEKLSARESSGKCGQHHSSFWPRNTGSKMNDSQLWICSPLPWSCSKLWHFLDCLKMLG